MASKVVRRLNKVIDTLNDRNISQYAYDKFVENTPIRSGNARRKTKLANNEIRAEYPYAQRLEEGYSRQAPDGMTEPTIEEVRKYVRTTLGVTI